MSWPTTGEEMLRAIRALPDNELAMVLNDFMKSLWPEAVRKAYQLAYKQVNKEHREWLMANGLHGLVRAEAASMCLERIEEFHAKAYDLAWSTTKRYKNRRGSPKILKRNLELYQLRMSDPGKWTWGKLARRFKLNSTDAAKKAFNAAKKFLSEHPGHPAGGEI